MDDDAISEVPASANHSAGDVILAESESTVTAAPVAMNLASSEVLDDDGGPGDDAPDETAAGPGASSDLASVVSDAIETIRALNETGETAPSLSLPSQAPLCPDEFFRPLATRNEINPAAVEELTNVGAVLDLLVFRDPDEQPHYPDGTQYTPREFARRVSQQVPQEVGYFDCTLRETAPSARQHLLALVAAEVRILLSSQECAGV